MAIILSFVITVYDKESYILEVIDSILSQEIDVECEYIFIDDGSSDKSLEFITSATRDISNCTIISHKNRGVVESTILGIHAAKGDFIKFVDGDDVLLGNIAAIQLEILMRDESLSYVACSIGVKKNSVIEPGFRKYPIIGSSLEEGDLDYFSGENALYTVLARKDGYTEALTGVTMGMSRKACINLDVVQEIINKYKIRQVQDHLISAVSLLGKESRFAFIKRIGCVELSKSNSVEANKTLSNRNSRSREEAVLINYYLSFTLSGELKNKLVFRDVNRAYRVVYGRVERFQRLNPLSLYNRLKLVMFLGNSFFVSSAYNSLVSKIISVREQRVS
jgi:glycosyltransferase involved in cell wall biosynthesis